MRSPRPDPPARPAVTSWAHHSALFDANPHATFALSLDGRFTDVNDITAELSGYGREQLLGLDFGRLVDADHLETATETFGLAASGKPQKVQIAMRTSHGTSLDLNVAIVPVVVDDVVVGVAGIAEDITAENAMRRDLEAARVAAEGAAEAKSMFLATMSHEVRTPLTSMLASAELLDDGELSPSQQHLLGIMHRSGQRLLRLVSDILDVSRLEAGRLSLTVESISVAALLDEVLAWARPQADARELELSLVIAPGTPERLQADPLRVAQVVTNLVGNAVKFTDTGQVRLRLDPAELTGESALRITVEDTGPGIAPDQLERVFESFTQADGSRTRRHGGAGLGLAICRELIELLGGTLEATSELGTGSTFTATVPVRSPHGPR